MLIYLSFSDSHEEKLKIGRLYEAYRQIMFYAANRILTDEYASEDAVHQAFLRVIENLDKIDEENPMKTRGFLVVITEHIATDIYRKRKRESFTSLDEAEIYIADEKSSPESYSGELEQALAKIPVNYSVVLRLKFYHGYSDIEIAKILKITEENVRQRISRAKRRLAEKLEEVSQLA